MSKSKKKKDNSLVLVIIIILLLIFIIYLLFLKKDVKENLSTGNTNIFNIDCNCITNEDKEQNDDSNTSIDSNTNTNINYNQIKETIKQEDNSIFVTDNKLTWSNSTNLNIFEDTMYTATGKIAPGSTNTYKFVVKNNTKYNVDYNIKFIETNKYHINMKYRLKKGKTYVIGDSNSWVTYDALNLNNVSLTTSNSDTYYLEWKWFDSDNDNEIGKRKNVKYSLGINIEAKQNND